MRRRPLALLALVPLVALAAACSGDDDGGAAGTTTESTTTTTAVPSPGMNEVQYLGSHNSYHLRPDPDVLQGIAAFSAPLAAELDYEHLPLTEQLEDFGVRQFEIDVYADPDGGRFADRPVLALLDRPTASGEPLLDEPGYKVLHQSDIDFKSSCVTFVLCLEEIEAWSSANPDHVPIMIMIEAKQDALPDSAESGGLDLSSLGIDFTEVLRLDRDLFDVLEAEILSVFDREQIIAPDDVRGDAATLEEAVLAGDAWPTLDEARGKVLFGLVDTGPTAEVYKGDATSLEGRLLFTSATEGNPDAAFIRVDDPVTEGDRIRELVEQGYLIRTRTDVPAVDAVNGDTTRRDAALESGAQYLSTDYYVEDPELGTGYVVTVPGTSAPEPGVRCNPVNAPPDCEV